MAHYFSLLTKWWLSSPLFKISFSCQLVKQLVSTWWPRQDVLLLTCCVVPWCCSSKRRGRRRRRKRRRRRRRRRRTWARNLLLARVVPALTSPANPHVLLTSPSSFLIPALGPRCLLPCPRCRRKRRTPLRNWTARPAHPVRWEHTPCCWLLHFQCRRYLIRRWKRRRQRLHASPQIINKPDRWVSEPCAGYLGTQALHINPEIRLQMRLRNPMPRTHANTSKALTFIEGLHAALPALGILLLVFCAKMSPERSFQWISTEVQFIFICIPTFDDGTRL